MQPLRIGQVIGRVHPRVGSDNGLQQRTGVTPVSGLIVLACVKELVYQAQGLAEALEMNHFSFAQKA